jgi:hypothetical protein
MRLVLLALTVAAVAIALLLSLRRPAPSSSPAPRGDEPALAPSSPPPTPSERSRPTAAATTARRVTPPPSAPAGTAPSAPTDAGPDKRAEALAAWHARSSERDYAYWDLKLNLLRKVQACVGDKLGTTGAAEVNFHFKKQDGAWLADRAQLRDPSDEERAKMGAVDFRGADRELAQRCISEAFAGTTMPITGGTDELDQYEVRGQIMFPTSADRAWKETGVSP